MTQLPKSDVPSQRPAALAWRMVALLMGFSAITYLHRISISVAGTERIMTECSLSETEMGAVYSAYLLAYTLCMVPGGWLIDRWGAKKVLLLMGAGSAVFVALTGYGARAAEPWNAVFGSLLALRFLAGAVSAPIYPAAARTVAHYVAPPLRPLANGLVTGTALLSIAGTYPLFGALLDRVDWPSAFALTALVTALWTGCWAVGAIDDRPGRPSQSAGEPPGAKSLPSRLDAEPAGASAMRPGCLSLLTASYAAYCYLQYLFFYWQEHYFQEVLRLDIEMSRYYSTLTSLAMAAGMALGGWLCGLLDGRHGPETRKAVAVAGMVGSALFAESAALGEQPRFVLTMFALATGTLGLCEGAYWTSAVELGGRRGGLSASILNTGGNFGGLLAPVVTPWFSQRYGWQAGFALAGGVCLAGAALWWPIVLGGGKPAELNRR